jgi:hypothetical protein
MAETLSIGRIGTPFDGKIGDVIYRVRQALPPAKYQYLVVSDNASNLDGIDLLTVNNFHSVKEKLKKRAKKGIGFEMTVAHARKMDGHGAARWFSDLRELYEFCHSTRCQLVLSSGANSAREMVSGPCLDVILKTCGIDPRRHWVEMSEWLESRLSRRVAA